MTDARQEIDQEQSQQILQSRRAATDSAQQEERFVYAGYHSIISGVDRHWDYGGFPLPDGSFWRYREPNAVVVVEGNRLRVARFRNALP